MYMLMTRQVVSKLSIRPIFDIMGINSASFSLIMDLFKL